MKELTMSGDRRMTVREVAEILEVSEETIKRSIRELYPDLMQNGKTTFLNEGQVTEVKYNLRKTVQVIKTAKTDLEKELLIQQALVFQQEKIERLQAENAQIRQERDVAEAERDYEREEHNGTKKVLAFQVAGNKHHQNMLEALGAIRTDREDMLDTYRRG